MLVLWLWHQIMVGNAGNKRGWCETSSKNTHTHAGFPVLPYETCASTCVYINTLFSFSVKDTLWAYMFNLSVCAPFHPF